MKRTGRWQTGLVCFRPAVVSPTWKSLRVAILGEADEAQADRLECEWKNRDVRFVRNLPLPRIAAILERATFIGHDSGISHLAAAAGANCILLFGPTDPDIWAPKNDNVRVLRPPSGKLSDLQIETVEAALAGAASCSVRCPQRKFLPRRDYNLRWGQRTLQKDCRWP